MEPISQNDGEHFDKWLDQLVQGHAETLPGPTDDLAVAALWLQEQRWAATCSGRFERKMRAQLDAANAGFFVLPATLIGNGPLGNHLDSSRKRNGARFSYFLYAVAAVLVILPALILLNQGTDPRNEPQSIKAPFANLGQLSTPETEGNVPGILLFPNLIILGGDDYSPEIHVSSPNSNLELTLANRSEKTLVFSLPDMGVEQDVAPGSVVHLSIEDLLSSSPFEIRVPGSTTPEHEGVLYVDRIGADATSQASGQIEETRTS